MQSFQFFFLLFIRFFSILLLVYFIFNVLKKYFLFIHFSSHLSFSLSCIPFSTFTLLDLSFFAFHWFPLLSFFQFPFSLQTFFSFISSFRVFFQFSFPFSFYYAKTLLFILFSIFLFLYFTFLNRYSHVFSHSNSTLLPSLTIPFPFFFLFYPYFRSIFYLICLSYNIRTINSLVSFFVSFLIFSIFIFPSSSFINQIDRE